MLVFCLDYLAGKLCSSW